MLKNWKHKVSKLNAAISASLHKCRPFKKKELLKGIGILIGPAEFARGTLIYSL
jgi:hypothetical protein